ncbi:MAG: hypothetical protein CMH52_00235 [Myxococcales bacterium]|nr:hypothetical protein [Myxococcales bacterium]|tara:strand:+ start:519 stop:1013 length:495 start_codon:yes stop_codon:yes gene_type:complete
MKMNPSTAFTIRAARLIDLDQVVVLWGQLMEHHRSLEPRLYDTETHSPATWRAWVRRKLDESDSVIRVVERDGTVVGYILGSIGQRAPVYVVRTVGMIFDLVVDSDHRGQGLGRALVDDLTHEFNRRGITDIQVNYDPNNQEASYFWQALGFKTLLHEAYRRTE